MIMTADEIQTYLTKVVSHLTFTYQGKNCGIDPFSPTDFDMWFGDEEMNAKSIEEVMDTDFFGGKSIRKLAPIIDFD